MEPGGQIRAKGGQRCPKAGQTKARAEGDQKGAKGGIGNGGWVGGTLTLRYGSLLGNVSSTRAKVIDSFFDQNDSYPSTILFTFVISAKVV